MMTGASHGEVVEGLVPVIQYAYQQRAPLTHYKQLANVVFDMQELFQRQEKTSALARDQKFQPKSVAVG